MRKKSEGIFSLSSPFCVVYRVWAKQHMEFRFCARELLSGVNVRGKLKGVWEKMLVFHLLQHLASSFFLFFCQKPPLGGMEMLQTIRQSLQVGQLLRTKDSTRCILRFTTAEFHNNMSAHD